MYERQDEHPSNRSGVSPSLIVLIVLGVLALIFVLQNSDKTEVNFLMLEFGAPTWLTFLFAIVLGIALDRLFMFWRKRRQRRPLPPPPG